MSINKFDTNHYYKYVELKKKFNITYRNYSMDAVLAKDILYYVYENNNTRLKRNYLLDCLFSVGKLSNFSEVLKKEAIVFSFDNYGADHKNLLTLISSKFENSILLEWDEGSKRVLNPLILIKSFYELFVMRPFKGISLHDKFYFYTRLVKYKNFINEIEKYDDVIMTQKFVPFLSCFPTDSILCTFYRKRGVKSYCVQHGFHLAASEYSYYIPIDVINLENIQADYMLAWGNSIKDSMIRQGVADSRFLLAGNPKYSNIDIKIKNRIKKGNVIVCLARDLYVDYNIQLLQIITELCENGFVVNIKFHPRSNLDLYSDFLDDRFIILPIQTTVGDIRHEIKPEFAISFNSTIYFEFYLNSIITFRFHVGENEIKSNIDDTFIDFLDLRNLIEKFNETSFDKINEDVKRMVDNCIAIGKDEYFTILNDSRA
jgi:hypothetical protein